MNTEQFISSSPDICHGQPCFKGTRVLVSAVLELLAAGQSNEQIAQSFPGITSQHIQAAQQLASQLLQSDQYIPFRAA
jgi:uncharacterized protein (DUF433 family)